MLWQGRAHKKGANKVRGVQMRGIRGRKAENQYTIEAEPFLLCLPPWVPLSLYSESIQ